MRETLPISQMSREKNFAKEKNWDHEQIKDKKNAKIYQKYLIITLIPRLSRFES